MIGEEASWVHLVTRIFEIAGTAIIVVGAFGSPAVFLMSLALRTGSCETSRLQTFVQEVG